MYSPPYPCATPGHLPCFVLSLIYPKRVGNSKTGPDVSCRDLGDPVSRPGHVVHGPDGTGRDGEGGHTETRTESGTSMLYPCYYHCDRYIPGHFDLFDDPHHGLRSESAYEVSPETEEGPALSLDLVSETRTDERTDGPRVSEDGRSPVVRSRAEDDVIPSTNFVCENWSSRPAPFSPGLCRQGRVQGPSVHQTPSIVEVSFRLFPFRPEDGGPHPFRTTETTDSVWHRGRGGPESKPSPSLPPSTHTV